MPTSTTNCNTTRATIRRRIAKPPSGSAEGSIDAGAATLQPPRVSGAICVPGHGPCATPDGSTNDRNRRAQRHARETALRCVQSRRGSRAVADARRTSPSPHGTCRRAGPASGCPLAAVSAGPLARPRRRQPGTASSPWHAGQAAPGSGTPSTVIDFAVEVSYKAACSPPADRAGHDRRTGVTDARAHAGPASTAAGITTVTYSGQRTIGTAGTWTYEFAARLTAADPWVILAGQRPGGAHDQRASHPEADAQAHAEAKAHTQADAQADPEGDRQPKPTAKADQGAAEGDPEAAPDPRTGDDVGSEGDPGRHHPAGHRGAERAVRLRPPAIRTRRDPPSTDGRGPAASRRPAATPRPGPHPADLAAPHGDVAVRHRARPHRVGGVRDGRFAAVRLRPCQADRGG